MEVRQFGLVFMGTMVGYLANGMFQDVLIMPMVSMYLFFLGGCVRNLNTRFNATPVPANSLVGR